MRASSQQSLRHNGFTIVELLIVIVVIGILAAITIVAYNGIQNRAKTAAVQSDLTSVTKILENYKISNAPTNNAELYPADTAAAVAAGLKVSSGNSFTYSANNGVSPASYCAAVTNDTTTYNVTNTTGAQPGPCVSSNGLIGYWSLNGNTNDTSGSGNTGAPTGASAALGQNGATNGGYSFGVAPGYIALGNGATFNQPRITLSAWIKTTATGLQTTVAKEKQYKCNFNSTSITSYYSADGVNWAPALVASVNVSTGQWHLFSCTFDSVSNTRQIFFDGALVATGTAAANTAYNTQFLMVGAYSTVGTEQLYGAIDDIRVYNRALSTAEVQSLYGAGAQ